MILPQQFREPGFVGIRSSTSGFAPVTGSDNVRNFVERDQALISAALDGDRGVLMRAVEMIKDAANNARRSGVPLDDADFNELSERGFE